MSKNSKSKNNRSKKKRSRNKNNSSRQHNTRAEVRAIEAIEPAASEQLNNVPTNDDAEVEVKLYTSDVEEEQPAEVVEAETEEVQPKEAEPEIEPEDEQAAEELEVQAEDERPAEEPAEVEQTSEETVDKPESELEEVHPVETEPEIEPEEKQAAEEPEVQAEDEQPAEEPAEEEQTESAAPAPAKKHKAHTGIKVLLALAVILAYSAAVIYGFFWIDDNIIDPDIYPAGTTINGVDVSGLDKDQAKDALTDDWNKHSISIFNVYGNEIGEIDDFDFSYDIDDQLEHALSPGPETALKRFFEKDKDDIQVVMHPAKATGKFMKQFKNLSIVKEAKGNKPSKNAYIDKSDTEFRIVKEVIGNSVDTKVLRQAIFDAIARGDEVFNYRRSDYHKIPDIVSTSESLLEERKYCKKYLSFIIRLRNPVNDYTIPPSWLDKMIKVSENGKVTVNDEQVSQFISETLYPKFSSVGDTRTLKSAGGGSYTISGGTYGYTLDIEKEHQALTSELKGREDVEREPYYSGRTPGKNWKNDIGNDFVEVSIEKQKCWVVRHGKTVVDTSVVTGVLPRHRTPTGVFYIIYKDTNATLRGRNDDGSKYESHVAYWMPFYLGFGLHDANWRGAFGGTIYINNGSHGCVNCPPSIMPTIFSNCYEGMPVIVH